MGTCLSVHECPVHSCSASSFQPHGHMGLYCLMGGGSEGGGVIVRKNDGSIVADLELRKSCQVVKSCSSEVSQRFKKH